MIQAATSILVALNLAIWFYESQSERDFSKFAFNIIDFKDGQFYRCVTASFLHGDLSHLLNNMVEMLPFCLFLESHYGFFYMLFVYFICGLGGWIGTGIHKVKAHGPQIAQFIETRGSSPNAYGTTFFVLVANPWVAVPKAGLYLWAMIFLPELVHSRSRLSFKKGYLCLLQIPLFIIFTRFVPKKLPCCICFFVYILRDIFIKSFPNFTRHPPHPSMSTADTMSHLAAMVTGLLLGLLLHFFSFFGNIAVIAFMTLFFVYEEIYFKGEPTC